MELFITIFSVIWFVFFTCIANYCVYSNIKKGYTIKKVHLIPLILDIMATSWLLKMVMQWAS